MLDSIKRAHLFLVRKHIYFIVWLLFGLWVIKHFDLFGLGLPLTDDQGHSLR
jgi:hypothetical protein